MAKWECAAAVTESAPKNRRSEKNTHNKERKNGTKVQNENVSSKSRRIQIYTHICSSNYSNKNEKGRQHFLLYHYKRMEKNKVSTQSSKTHVQSKHTETIFTLKHFRVSILKAPTKMHPSQWTQRKRGHLSFCRCILENTHKLNRFLVPSSSFGRHCQRVHTAREENGIQRPTARDKEWSQFSLACRCIKRANCVRKPVALGLAGCHTIVLSLLYRE